MSTPNLKAMATVEAILQAQYGTGQTAAAITRQATGYTLRQVNTALANLAAQGRAHSVPASAKLYLHYAGPMPRNTTHRIDRASRLTGTYVPPQWTNEIARPAGEHHKRHGSLQADGTVKPYRVPAHGCVGTLKDRTSNAKD